MPASCPPELTGFDRVLVDAPCSGLGVLASRPDLRWRAQPLPELQRELLQVAAERVKPDGTIVYSVCTMARAENEDVVDASGLVVDPLGEGWPEFAHPRRPEFLLTLPHKHHTSGFFIAQNPPRCAWADWIRGAEIEPSLYAADFSRLGEQIRILLDAGARLFHFDVGDAHFVPPVTIGPIVLESISPIVHEGGGRLDCHLMVDEPTKHFEAIAAAGGDSVTFHIEAVGDIEATAAAAREHGLATGLAFKPETEPEQAAEAAAACGHRPLHEHRARLLGAGLHARGDPADRAPPQAAARREAHPGGRRRRPRERRAAARGRHGPPGRPARASSARTTSPPPTASLPR